MSYLFNNKETKASGRSCASKIHLLKYASFWQNKIWFYILFHNVSREFQKHDFKMKTNNISYRIADVPYVTIPAECGLLHSYRGSKTLIQPKIISCPSYNSVEWQYSSDGHMFRAIDISKPHYYGSSKNPGSPQLVIPKTTLDDMLHYRLLVWNNIGYQCSKAVYLSVTGSMYHTIHYHY